MEINDASENEICPVNVDAPPVLFQSFQNNNINIYNNPNLNNIPNFNNNINNFNINESSFNLLSNDINNNKNMQINLIKNFNLNNINNQNLQHPNFKSNPYLVQNQMNQQQYLMHLNYINQMQKKNINNINNINVPYNNINNSNIINNIKDYYNLTIDINLNHLMKLDQKSLIEIILFIRDICNIQIEERFSHLQHELFKIHKIPNKNMLLFSIKYKNEKSLFNNVNQNNKNNIININNNNEIEDDENNNSNSDEEKDNIINENNIFENNDKIDNEENQNKFSNFMFCKLHQTLYFLSEYEEHLKSHKICHICDNEFKSKRALKIHLMKIHLNISQKNNNKFKNEIRCIVCLQKFSCVEAMNTHYYY